MTTRANGRLKTIGIGTAVAIVGGMVAGAVSYGMFRGSATAGLEVFRVKTDACAASMAELNRRVEVEMRESELKSEASDRRMWIKIAEIQEKSGERYNAVQRELGALSKSIEFLVEQAKK